MIVNKALQEICLEGHYFVVLQYSVFAKNLKRFLALVLWSDSFKWRPSSTTVSYGQQQHPYNPNQTLIALKWGNPCEPCLIFKLNHRTTRYPTNSIAADKVRLLLPFDSCKRLKQSRKVTLSCKKLRIYCEYFIYKLYTFCKKLPLRLLCCNSTSPWSKFSLQIKPAFRNKCR